jgi:hypothetical protein
MVKVEREDWPGDRSTDLEYPDSTERAMPVLCREEALVYVENFFRGDRTAADLAALASFLRLLPKEEEASFPFDPGFILQQVTKELATLRSGRG